MFILLLTAIVCPIYLIPNYTEATTGTATASTLTFTGTNLVASASLTVDSPTGTFTTSTTNQKATFSISTNNYTGYTLTMKSSGNTTTLSDNNSNTITTISSSTTATNFASSDATGQALNNKWGYIPNYYNATGSNPATNTTNYYPAPTSTNIATLRTTSSANSADGTSNADDYTIGLGVRADYTSPSGTYTNDTFILEYVVNPTPYTINFSDNTGDASVSGIPGVAYSGSVSSSSIILPNTLPTRTGYTFNKWCLGTVSGNGTICTGNTYDAGGAYGIDQTIASNNATLYATWSLNQYNLVVTSDVNVDSLSVKKGSTTGTSTTCTKAGTTFTCPDLDYGMTYYLYPEFVITHEFGSWSKTDSVVGSALGSSTDENTFYTVGVGNGAITLTSIPKIYLQDMSFAECKKNVGTNGNPATVGDNVKVYDRRDNNKYTVRYINGQCWMTQNLRIMGTISATDSNFTGPDFNVSEYSLSSSDPTYTSQCGSNDDYNLACAKYSDSTITGSWYNYYAASAGTVNSNYKWAVSSGDICPANWHLPSGLGTTKDTDISRLVGNTVSGWQDPTPGFTAFDPVAGGMYTNNGLRDYTGYGNWWTSIERSSNERYMLDYRSTDGRFQIDNYVNRHTGRFIRCVRIPSTIEDIAYLQDVTPTLVDNTTRGTSVALLDARDGKQYNVAKLNDDKLWMTNNINLAGGTILESEGSNVASGHTFNNPYYTLPASATIISGSTIDSSQFSNNSPYVFNTNDATCSSGPPCSSYYSWLAATAGGKDSNGNDATGNGQNAAYSICPKAWRLPVVIENNTQLSPSWKSGDWYTLGTSYGVEFGGSGGQNASTFYDNAGPGTLPNYQIAGQYNSGVQYDTSAGRYWSSTSQNSTQAYYMRFDENSIWLPYDGRNDGDSVRCTLETRTILDLTYLQEVTQTITNNTAIGTTKSLIDSRDGKAYNVRKTSDGNIWFLDNLALDITDASVQSKLNSATTNASNLTISYLKGDVSRDATIDTDGGYATAGVSKNWTSGFSWSAPLIAVDSSTSGPCNDDFCVNSNKTWSSNSVIPATINGVTSLAQGKIGIYYNYCAATAGSYCYGNSNITPGPSTYRDATEDICPRGWHLPFRGVEREGYLRTYEEGFNSNYINYQIALNTPLSGFYHDDGKAYNQGNYGYYWSNQQNWSQESYILGVDATSANFGTTVLSRRFGASIRCVAYR